MSSKQKPRLGAENLSDLISRAITGDQDAFTALYEATSQEVYATVRSMVRTEELALDIQQDSYVFAFTHLNQLGDPAKFRAWLRTIAVNRTRSVLRRQTPVLFSELDLEHDPLLELPEFSTEASPELSLDQKETTRLIREILDELTDGQRMLVGLYYYEQMPVGRIAHTLEVTPGTVKKQLSRARKKIEAAVKRLEEKGVKLYGLSPLPFLLALLHQQEPAAETGKAVLAKAVEEAGLAAGAKAAAPVAESVAVHVGRPFFETALGKLILGVVSVSVIGGGVLGYRWIQAKAAYGNTRPSERIAYTEHTTDPVVLENIIPTVPESYNETPEDLITEPVTTESVTEAEPTEPASSAPERPTEPAPSESERPTETAPSASGQSADPMPSESSPAPDEDLLPRVVSCSWGESSEIYDQPWGSSRCVYVITENGGVPWLYTDNENMVQIQSEGRFHGGDLQEGQTGYYWTVTFLGSGTANIYCELDWKITHVLTVTNPEYPEMILECDVFISQSDSFELKPGEWTSIDLLVQGMTKPCVYTDRPDVIDLYLCSGFSNSQTSWIHKGYSWNAVYRASGTTHIFVELNGKRYKTYTVVAVGPEPTEPTEETCAQEETTVP